MLNVVCGNQVTATNNAFTSPSSEVMDITFDEAGDVDELGAMNASSEGGALRLSWTRVRGADGYRVRVQLPLDYAQMPLITTRDTNVTREFLFFFFNCYKVYHRPVISISFFLNIFFSFVYLSVGILVL